MPIVCFDKEYGKILYGKAYGGVLVPFNIYLC